MREIRKGGRGVEFTPGKVDDENPIGRIDVIPDVYFSYGTRNAAIKIAREKGIPFIQVNRGLCEMVVRAKNKYVG